MGSRLAGALLLFSAAVRLLGGFFFPQMTVFAAPRFPCRGPVERVPAAVGLRRPKYQAVPGQNAGVPLGKPVFSGADKAFIRWEAGDFDPESLLKKPLVWDLRQEGPTVLILHTHGTECYTKEPGQDFSYTGSFRTENTDYNMVSIGDALAARLEAAGIRVIHDRTLFDSPSYTGAYEAARKAVEAHLQENPQICLVLDLHRDSAVRADGSQYATSVPGRDLAQLMPVLGNNASGKHPLWQENLALGLKLQVLLEKRVPGITRKGLLRSSRYNQDLCPGSLLVEVGSAGNTHSQALAAAAYLADAIIALAGGSTTTEAT